ncbi:hypothetical protein CEUSTIGMA_g3371.t1 [Chlamydomonas eustigma]|uniref:AP2/ERF domain-containing protein n=1 Tax=Chlamydomonas eustigma TaxID=1157962 RepID=A0A250WYK9_9CHLO|nr:hypothetical protein CEUSTIGMA_g3371.t1 [Chlamydomonas eustigma]|eukprot:GAX75928.1 hypothetical protein CEUSTIGMA_g3371.t1 [Chlamydomonas eustigma]
MYTDHMRHDSVSPSNLHNPHDWDMHGIRQRKNGLWKVQVKEVVTGGKLELGSYPSLEEAISVRNGAICKMARFQNQWEGSTKSRNLQRGTPESRPERWSSLPHEEAPQILRNCHSLASLTVPSPRPDESMPHPLMLPHPLQPWPYTPQHQHASQRKKIKMRRSVSYPDNSYLSSPKEDTHRTHSETTAGHHGDKHLKQPCLHSHQAPHRMEPLLEWRAHLQPWSQSSEHPHDHDIKEGTRMPTRMSQHFFSTLHQPYVNSMHLHGRGSSPSARLDTQQLPVPLHCPPPQSVSSSVLPAQGSILSNQSSCGSPCRSGPKDHTGAGIFHSSLHAHVPLGWRPTTRTGYTSKSVPDGVTNLGTDVTLNDVGGRHFFGGSVDESVREQKIQHVDRRSSEPTSCTSVKQYSLGHCSQPFSESLLDVPYCSHPHSSQLAHERWLETQQPLVPLHLPPQQLVPPSKRWKALSTEHSSERISSPPVQHVGRCPSIYPSSSSSSLVPNMTPPYPFHFPYPFPTPYLFMPPNFSNLTPLQIDQIKKAWKKIKSSGKQSISTSHSMAFSSPDLRGPTVSAQDHHAVQLDAVQQPTHCVAEPASIHTIGFIDSHSGEALQGLYSVMKPASSEPQLAGNVSSSVTASATVAAAAAAAVVASSVVTSPAPSSPGSSFLDDDFGIFLNECWRLQCEDAVGSMQSSLGEEVVSNKGPIMDLPVGNSTSATPEQMTPTSGPAPNISATPEQMTPTSGPAPNISATLMHQPLPGHGGGYNNAGAGCGHVASAAIIEAQGQGWDDKEGIFKESYMSFLDGHSLEQPAAAGGVDSSVKLMTGVEMAAAMARSLQIPESLNQDDFCLDGLIL